MTLELVVVEGLDQTVRTPLRDNMVIGRRSDCDLQLANETVSGRHARIVGSGPEFSIEDMGSQNSTIVEGGPTLSKGQTHALQAGTTIVMGKVKLRVEGAAALDDMATMAGGDMATIAGAGIGVADPGATLPQEKDESTVFPAGRIERPASAAATPPPAAASDAGSEFVTMGLTPDQQGGAFEDVASLGALKALRPRVVIDHELKREIVDISSLEFTIGREECQMNVAHSAVSGRHAKIVFDTAHKRLRLVDLGSKNFTFLAGELVPPDVPRELTPDSHIRVGPIDLLFVMDRDYDGEPLPQKTLETAAEMLEADGTITAEQHKNAQASAKSDNRHIGEMLILKGAVSAKRWVRALDHAELAIVTRALPNPEIKQLRTIVYALAGLVLLLFILVFTVGG